MGEGNDPPRRILSTCRQTEPERYSRHSCDFYQLIRHGVATSAAAQLDLLARVAQHKSLFFKSSWAGYDKAVKGSLRILPNEQRWEALREDYLKMQEMFFGESANFTEIMILLQKWEIDFNQA